MIYGQNSRVHMCTAANIFELLVWDSLLLHVYANVSTGNITFIYYWHLRKPQGLVFIYRNLTFNFKHRLHFLKSYIKFSALEVLVARVLKIYVLNLISVKKNGPPGLLWTFRYTCIWPPISFYFILFCFILFYFSNITLTNTPLLSLMWRFLHFSVKNLRLLITLFYCKSL